LSYSEEEGEEKQTPLSDSEGKETESKKRSRQVHMLSDSEEDADEARVKVSSVL
jgi:hypothetical protein